MLWLFVPPAPWRLFDAYRFLIRQKIGRDHNRQAIGKLRKFAVFALFEGLWKALGRCSSPVCRINEKLANTAFASSFFARKSGLPLILTLIDAYGSAKPILALFARRAMIPFAGVLRSVLSFLQKRSAPRCMSYSRERFCILSIYRLSILVIFVFLVLIKLSGIYSSFRQSCCSICLL